MLRKLASETAIYGGTTILVRLINVALIPLHTGLFQPEGYGLIAEFYAYAIAANALYSYGMQTAFFRFTTKKGGDQQENFNLIFSMLLVTSFVFSGSFIFFSKDIAVAMGHPTGQKFVIWFALIFAIDALLAIPFAQLRIMGKARQFALTKIFNILMVFFLNVFFIWFCREVYEGNFLKGFQGIIATFYDPKLGSGYVFLANLIGNGLLLLVFWKTFAVFKFKINSAKQKELLIYGLPILFSGLAFAINESADKIFLKYWLPENFYFNFNSMEAMGVYAANYKLSIFITLGIQAFNYAAEPFFFSRAEDKNSREVYATVMKYFIIVCMIVMAGVCANLDWLKYFIPNEVYWAGLNVVPILLLANVFLGIYYNLSVWFKVTDKTYFGLYFSVIGALITIIFNYVLIPIIGYTGSAVSTLCCYFSMTLFCYFFGKKHFFVSYHLRSAFAYISVFGIIGFAITWINLEMTYLNILLKNGILIVLVLLVALKEKTKLLKLMK
ncbi:lipopolysaccharide biosynthesis protein [Flexithrix dorotheae]|uniref:lipopolysaccharide biosynthesis protein n=1 Tax=Flexithrix dorotheae TaxID=70993 RepID=UPI0003676031|nr:polysaccharide biosynthesis C-terminal domain-containing protein [Flexithrix dorotheae]